jgi:hypothetical protein
MRNQRDVRKRIVVQNEMTFEILETPGWRGGCKKGK